MSYPTIKETRERREKLVLDILREDLEMDRAGFISIDEDYMPGLAEEIVAKLCGDRP